MSNQNPTPTHWLDTITRENFHLSFHLQNILTDSVFYPGSGYDGRDLTDLSPHSRSFVHVDYTVLKEDLEHALLQDMDKAGFQRVGLKYLQPGDLYPGPVVPPYPFPMPQWRRQALYMVTKMAEGLIPYAIWAVFEPKPGLLDPRKRTFSILHIGWEACSIFQALYSYNRINPLGIAICFEGAGSRMNWTRFSDSNSPFYQLIEANVREHGLRYPRYLLTHHQDKVADWPNYRFKAYSRFPFFGLFEYQGTLN